MSVTRSTLRIRPSEACADPTESSRAEVPHIDRTSSTSRWCFDSRASRSIRESSLTSARSNPDRQQSECERRWYRVALPNGSQERLVKEILDRKTRIY